MIKYYTVVKSSGQFGGEIVAFGKVMDNDFSDPELTHMDVFEARLEAAIQNGYLVDGDFTITEDYDNSFYLECLKDYRKGCWDGVEI